MSSSRGRKPDRQRIHLTERPAENPAEELAEIEIYKTQSITEDDFCVGLTARFGSMAVSCENWVYSVNTTIKEAYVHIATDNCAVARDGRYGDDPRPLDYLANRNVKLTTVEKTKIDGGGKIEAGIGAKGLRLPSLGFNLSGQASKSSEAKSSESHKIQEVTRSITALPGDKWRLSDLISATLQGKYEPSEHLCKISVKSGARSGAVVARMFFYPKDISLEVHETEQGGVGRIFKERPGNLAVAKALLGKHLRGLNAANAKHADGRIILGNSQLDYKISDDEH